MLQDTINETCCSQDISFLTHLHLYTVLIKTTSFICLCLCKFENPEQISIKPGNGEFYKNCQVVSVFGIQYMKTFMCLCILTITPYITGGVKNVLNKDCKEELNTQFVSSLDFEELLQ